MKRSEKHFYEFGSFRLDPVERLLLRDGQHVPLTPKAFETLLILVENGGQVIDKDELIRKVWPDTFVEEVNLAKNVSNLRKVLGGEQSAQYIETIPRRGYRFVADVRDVCDNYDRSGLLSHPDSTVSGLIDRESRSGENNLEVQQSRDLIERERRAGPSTIVTSAWAWLSVLLVLGLMLCAGIWLMASRSVRPAPSTLLKIVPFTSFPGKETHAAFSPDANQIAYVGEDQKGEASHIYVKLIGTGQPLRLTTAPAADSHPAWSPDGRYIAFLRQTTESSSFYLISALGGPERKITDVFPYRTRAQGNTQYYSPDGKYLAVIDKESQAEPFSIYLVSIENGEKRKLTAPPAGIIGDSYPSYSNDGKTLAFLRSTSRGTTDLYLLNLGGGSPVRLTYDSSSIIGLAWTADNREIVFASRREGSIYSLWRIPVAGGTPERLATIGQSVISPTISRKGNRLAYTLTLDDQNIWQLEMGAAGRFGSPRSLISSTLDDGGPDYSPNGQKIVFSSTRSGGFGIWVCDRDGSNPLLLIDRGPYLTGTPRWSPDGRWIAYDSRSHDLGQDGNADIYIISSEGGQPSRLTKEPSEDVAPSWSRDGKWIYFGSMRSGSMQIWKISAQGGQAIQVTKHGGFEGFESFDGKIFYYSKDRAVPGLWQIPVGGGEEKLLIEHKEAGYWRLWTVTEKGIYYATASAPSQPVIEFFSFETGKYSTIYTLDRQISRSQPGLAVSPDGRSLLFTQLDQSGSDIMLVEDFH